MRLSFREFHMQFDPTLRRERVPEAMFELLGPTPSAKPVFEGKPLPAPKQDEPQEMTDAEQPADAAAAAQPNGTGAEAAAEAAPAAADTAAVGAPAVEDPDAVEPVPEIAQQLYAQVLLPHLLLGSCTAFTHGGCLMHRILVHCWQRQCSCWKCSSAGCAVLPGMSCPQSNLCSTHVVLPSRTSDLSICVRFT